MALGNHERQGPKLLEFTGTKRWLGGERSVQSESSLWTGTRGHQVAQYCARGHGARGGPSLGKDPRNSYDVQPPKFPLVAKKEVLSSSTQQVYNSDRHKTRRFLRECLRRQEVSAGPGSSAAQVRPSLNFP